MIEKGIAVATNFSTPVASPLSREVREQVLRIAGAHGATSVSLFGSLARGEGSDDSDLDLLLDLEPGRSLLDLIAIEQDLEDLLGRPVDALTRHGLSPYLRDRVLAEAIPL